MSVITFLFLKNVVGHPSAIRRNIKRVSSNRFSWLAWGCGMAEVRLQEGESLENALRRFKRKVMTEDIIKDVKRHSYYLKPGERRRGETSIGSKACSKEDSQGLGSSCTEASRCCQVSGMRG